MGYKKISKTLNIPLSTVKSIIKKWKEYGTTTNLPRECRSPKLTDQARRALIREATKRPKITQKELQSSTAEIGVSIHRTTLSRTLHRAGLYRRVDRKKTLLKENNKQTHLVFAKRHVGDSPNIWKNGQMRVKLSFLAVKENSMSGTNPTPPITPRTPSPQ